MIEKLARAIADPTFGPFDSMTKRDQDKLTNAARACLEALREPSEAMLRAVDDEDSDRMVARGRAYSAWQAMIDVALERKAA